MTVIKKNPVLSFPLTQNLVGKLRNALISHLVKHWLKKLQVTRGSTWFKCVLFLFSVVISCYFHPSQHTDTHTVHVHTLIHKTNTHTQTHTHTHTHKSPFNSGSAAFSKDKVWFVPVPKCLIISWWEFNGWHNSFQTAGHRKHMSTL